MMNPCRWSVLVIFLMAISANAYAEVSMTAAQAMEDKEAVLVYSSGAELKVKILKAVDDVVVVERMSDQKIMEVPRHEIVELKGLKKTVEAPTHRQAAPYDDPRSSRHSSHPYDSRYAQDRGERSARLSDLDKELLLKQQEKGKKILTVGAILLPTGVLLSILAPIVGVNNAYDSCINNFSENNYNCGSKASGIILGLGIPGGFMIPTGIIMIAVGAVKKNKAKRELQRHGVRASVTPWLQRDQNYEGVPLDTYAGGLQLNLNF